MGGDGPSRAILHIAGWRVSFSIRCIVMMHIYPNVHPQSPGLTFQFVMCMLPGSFKKNRRTSARPEHGREPCFHRT